MTCSVLCRSLSTEEDEEFLVLLEYSPDALELMQERRDRLQRGEPVRAQLDRQPQVFRSSPNAQRFELPPEFYNMTSEELKKEQLQRYRLLVNGLNSRSYRNYIYTWIMSFFWSSSGSCHNPVSSILDQLKLIISCTRAKITQLNNACIL